MNQKTNDIIREAYPELDDTIINSIKTCPSCATLFTMFKKHSVLYYREGDDKCTQCGYTRHIVAISQDKKICCDCYAYNISKDMTARLCIKQNHIDELTKEIEVYKERSFLRGMEREQVLQRNTELNEEIYALKKKIIKLTQLLDGITTQANDWTKLCDCGELKEGFHDESCMTSKIRKDIDNILDGVQQ